MKSLEKTLMELPESVIKKIPLNQIKTLDFDRKLINAQVDNILRSLFEFGILRLMVVLETTAINGTVEYYNIDGKHLKYALLKAGKTETNCIIFSCNDLDKIVKAMAKLNNVQVTWTAENYVMAFRTMKKSDYNDLYLYHLANGFTYPICAKILGQSDTIKNGLFKVTNKDFEELTNCLLDITNLLGTSSARFMMAYITFFRSAMKKEYNHKSFMKKMAVIKGKFKILDDYKEMAHNLEEIYAI